jgi:hypothetical protein
MFIVCGDFDPTRLPHLSRAKYRSRGPGHGVDVGAFRGPRHAELLDLAPVRALAATDPALHAAIRATPGHLLVRGDLPDPPDHDALRDAIGLVTWALDHGGVAAITPQTLTVRSPAAWHEELFLHDRLDPGAHVVILASEDERRPGREWLHTRGLRQFARPDLSVRGVPPDGREAALDLVERFVALQVDGARIPDGQPVRVRGVPEGMVCRHAGGLDDPDFNNVHLELAWPTTDDAGA